MHLPPDPVVTPDDVERGKRVLVKDAAWASLVGALYGGVILVGFAIELGATPWHIGVLSAVPFLAQVAQLPAIALIEKLGQRRKIAVVSAGISRLLIGSLALLVLVPDRTSALRLLVAAQVAITLFGSFAGCAFNCWLHQLLASQGPGALFSRRLFWSTVLASIGALAAGYAIQRWHAYALSFAAAGVAGFIGLSYLATVPEPPPARTGPRLSSPCTSCSSWATAWAGSPRSGSRASSRTRSRCTCGAGSPTSSPTRRSSRWRCPPVSAG